MSKRVIMCAFKDERHETKEQDNEEHEEEEEVEEEVGGDGLTWRGRRRRQDPCSGTSTRWRWAAACPGGNGLIPETRLTGITAKPWNRCATWPRNRFSINTRNGDNPEQEFWIFKLPVEML